MLAQITMPYSMISFLLGKKGNNKFKGEFLHMQWKGQRSIILKTYMQLYQSMDTQNIHIHANMHIYIAFQVPSLSKIVIVILDGFSITTPDPSGGTVALIDTVNSSSYSKMGSSKVDIFTQTRVSLYGSVNIRGSVRMKSDPPWIARNINFPDPECCSS